MFSNKISKIIVKSLSSFALSRSGSSNSSSTNFGKGYSFAKNLDNGLKTAKLESKPLILIVHKTRCGACKVLLPSLAASDDVKKMSNNFVMVSALDGHEPKTSQYAPDGAYVPRIIFVRSDGKILTQVTNPSIKANEYKYYYQKSDDVVKSMKLALELNK